MHAHIPERRSAFKCHYSTGRGSDTGVGVDSLEAGFVRKQKSCYSRRRRLPYAAADTRMFGAQTARRNFPMILHKEFHTGESARERHQPAENAPQSRVAPGMPSRKALSTSANCSSVLDACGTSRTFITCTFPGADAVGLLSAGFMFA